MCRAHHAFLPRYNSQIPVVLFSRSHLFIYDDTLCTYGSEFQFGYGGHDYYIQEYREYDLNTGEKTLEYREEYHDGDLSEPYVAYPDIRDTSVFGSFKDVQEYMHTKTDKLYMVLWYGIR